MTLGNRGGFGGTLAVAMVLGGCHSDGVPAVDASVADLAAVVWAGPDLAAADLGSLVPDRAAPAGDLGGVALDEGAPDSADADLTAAVADLSLPDLAVADQSGVDLLRSDLAVVDLTVVRCPMGFADCNGNPGDGCETDILHDARHCGRCGVVCGPVCGKPGACGQGACLQHPCICGFEDCNGFPGDGCEVNVYTDVKNCGACGKACMNGQVCRVGACV